MAAQGPHASDHDSAAPAGVPAAESLMRRFMAQTGIAGEGDPGRRYLWTDAFAIFALLGLHRRTRREEHLEQAARLVELVHHTLGRWRLDDDRRGWISGLSEAEGSQRPTAGGLRIGKPLPERARGEPADDELEWERDGQYLHYLTKWMHALDRMAMVTGEHRYLAWALELAEAAHRAFVYQPASAGPKRMYWKMSVDLSRPAVASMGQLDPLDGFVTISRLRATRRRLRAPGPDLEAAEADLRAMCAGATWATGDALGIGGLLSEAGQLTRLTAAGDAKHDDLLPRLFADIERSLEFFAAQSPLASPPSRRLAFRELGLAIGLHAVPAMRVAIDSAPERFGGRAEAEAALNRIASIARFTPLAGRIEQTWLAPAARATDAWAAHEDINTVMLATSLVPEVYLLTESGDDQP